MKGIGILLELGHIYYKRLEKEKEGENSTIISSQE
jgi:hypothetical protein